MHTPGPFIALDTFPSIDIAQQDGPVIASVHRIPDTDVQANVRLFVKAPEMLTALRNAEPYCPVAMQDTIRALILGIKRK